MMGMTKREGEGGENTERRLLYGRERLKTIPGLLIAGVGKVE